MLRSLSLASVAVAGFLFSSCDKSENKKFYNNNIEFANKSVNPALAFTMPGFNNVGIYTLLSSEDALPNSPGFVYGAQPDGAGLLKDPNSDGYVLITNHEIIRSVSRVFLDKTLKPTKGEYIVDAIGGVWRLCSATMATPQEHGFGPLFLTAGESGQESMVHGIHPGSLVGDKARQDRVLPALGKASMENAVPLTKIAYPGKTIIMIGEDQSYSSNHLSAGQLAMYMSNTVGDLNNGSFFTLKRKDGNQVELDMTIGNSYEVEFVEIPNAKNISGAEINTQANALGAIRFSRVEDVDYGKGNPSNNRDVYFVATGQSPNGETNQEGYTMWGRLYRLKMNAGDPTKGTLEVLVDGDLTPGTGIINPDNVCVTENYVYIQEDGDSYYPAATHDSYVWQYNIKTKENKPFLNMNHKRTDAAWNSKYNTTNNNRLGSWEWGAMWDISDIIGVPGTFLANIHPHTWQDNKFFNPDGSGLNLNREGGQTVILRNVPR
ncbi:alkaline phosphatase PhoX [Lacibacter sediminis]|uniref:DUF839 domain-containing protein n=1 Tax=Lacibacter sediminis TaxID=2760713 RepID=A0A7G5XCW4_9BACT|nr:alkaline phosphatase PhoX [Lacibacter sediminis]QNA43317.1 hypothetical protein H4075_14670 [Lacibacter sediminis]